jgi:hypothetical protein
VVADLVQVQVLVLDRAVVELEAAGADEQAAPPVPRAERAPATQVGEQEQAATAENQLPAWKRPSETRPAAGVDLS